MDASRSSRNEDVESRIAATGYLQSAIHWTNAFQQRLSYYTELTGNDVNSLDLATRTSVQGEIDAELAELQTIDSLLTSFRSNLVGRRNMLSFAYLNPDVLIEIFTILRDCYTPRGDLLLEYPTLGWIAATHVCRRWRETACHEPSLWSPVVGSLGVHWYKESILRAQTLPLTIVVRGFHRIKLSDIFTPLVISEPESYPSVFRNVISITFEGRRSMLNTPLELIGTLSPLRFIPTLKEIGLHNCCFMRTTGPVASFEFLALTKLSVRGMKVHELTLMMELLRLSPACSVQLISADMSLTKLPRLTRQTVSQLNGDPAIKAPQFLRIGARALSLYRTLPAGGNTEGRPDVPEILSLGVPRTDMIWPADVLNSLGHHILRHLRFLHISYAPPLGQGLSSLPWDQLFMPCENVEAIYIGKGAHCSFLFKAIVSISPSYLTPGQPPRVLLPRLNRIEVEGRRSEHTGARSRNARTYRRVSEWGKWCPEEKLVAALTYRKNAGYPIETLRLNNCSVSEECEMEVLPALVKNIQITRSSS